MIHLSVPFKSVKKIIHLADIHIRLYKRHKEYIGQFNRLYKMLEANGVKDTAIVVAGDIVHTKTDLSPELIEVASEFLGNLAGIAPTIVIAGNHDMNLANQDRLDSLTPIIHNINHDDLHYLRNTGIYRMADVDFYVHSIIGEQADWHQRETESQTAVCLFHGPVHDATTDTHFQITNRHVNIETFNGFDMVLLGDIHKHQVLGTNPKIVYPGSLIQQNHGEAYKGHGWCEWDVASRTFVHHELPNDYGYYTLKIVNGVVPDYSDMPKNVRLRVFAGSMEPSEVKTLVADIRSKRNIAELSVSHFEGAKATVGGTNTAKILDIYDRNYQKQLITEFLRDGMPNLAPDVLDRVFDLNDSINDRVVTDDPTRKLVWKPLLLKFSNLFTYGDDNEINFRNMNGVIGIFAPNASGKTSIADALSFALYDRTPRTQKAANIMNNQSDKCYCEFHFEVEGVEYVIVRRGAKNKKGEVKIDVDFYKLVNSSKVSLNGEERRYTNGNIRQYVGDFDDFLLTTFSTQGNNALFVDRGQSDRKDLLSQFLGLNLFDRLHVIANDEIKEVAGALKRFKNDDFTEELAKLRGRAEQLRGEENTWQIGFSQVNERLNELSREIQELYGQKTPLNLRSTNLSQLESDRTNLASKLASLETDLMSADLAKTNQEKQLEKGKVKLVSDYSGVDEQMDAYRDHMGAKEALESDYRLHIMAIRGAERGLVHLDQHKFDPNCTYCVTNASSTITEKAKLTNTIQEAQEEAARCVERLGIVAGKLTALGNIEERHKKYVAGLNWVTAQEKLILKSEADNARLSTHIGQVQANLAKLNLEINEYHKSVDIIKKNGLIDSEIRIMEEEKAVEKAKFTRIQSALKQLHGESAVTSKSIEVLEGKIKEAAELEDKYEAYEAYLAAICRDGIPYRLISEVLPAVQQAVNNILGHMVEFTLVFDTDGKNVNIRLTYDDARVWSLELASGMERFISGLAIRVALMNVSSLPKSNFLIVDEGLGTLDPDNLASVSMLFEVLRAHFDFLWLISHVDSARDMADSRIEIARNNGFSKVTV